MVWLTGANGIDHATLKEILIFFTGTDKIPLPMNPTLKFSDNQSLVYLKKQIWMIQLKMMLLRKY